jgi:hypothetical protein
VGLLWFSCKKSFFLFSSSCYIVLGVVLLQFLSFYRILHLLFGGQKAAKSPGTVKIRITFVCKELRPAPSLVRI